MKQVIEHDTAFAFTFTTWKLLVLFGVNICQIWRFEANKSDELPSE